jgi:hypothetical protein
MIARIAKMAAYAKAPRATYAMLHPFKAAKYGAIYWVVKGMMGNRSKAK